MNSREKGKRGERQWRDELRANGYDARRGQQFSGSPDSPDVIYDSLPWAHFEVKAVERLNVEAAMNQARRDARQAGPAPTALRAGRIPIVAHRRNHSRWLVTMDAESFFRLLRGDFEPRRHEGHEAVQSLVTSAPTKDGARGATRPTDQQFSAAACAAATNQNQKGRSPITKQTNENPS
jgi:hypothetical protein